jgi:phenylpyruvate tautomerase PptA (4-oxalocrotonate tautomerase family)
MPLLSLLTSAPPPPPSEREVLFARLSGLLARQLTKPEKYVMVALAQRADMSFGGDAATPACYAELKNVGTLAAEQVSELAAILSAEISRALGVRPDRIYIEFTNADGALWGWNGETFA